MHDLNHGGEQVVPLSMLNYCSFFHTLKFKVGG